MEHIKKFETQEEFNLIKSVLPYPCVSYVEETDTVEYKKQSIITAKYKITQETMYAYNLLELTELPIYSNSQGALKSYSFNGETHTFEEPIYETIQKTVEFEQINVGDEYLYVPKFEYALSISNITTEHVFYANRTLDINNDIVGMIYYDIDGNIVQYEPLPLSFLIEDDFFILNIDNKSVSITQNFIYAIQSISNNGVSYISLFFAENSDLTKTPTIETINYEETLSNSDASLFNGKINIQLSDIEIDKEYELKLVLSDSAKSIGVYSTIGIFDEKELLERLEKLQDQNAVLIVEFYLSGALTKVDLTKIDKEKKYVIPSKSFMVCLSLEEVMMNHSISTISDYAFGLCLSLKKINIPNTVTRIGESSFNACQSLENIKLPDSLQFISDSAFSACTSLTSVTFGKNVREIGMKAFEYCYQLNEIIFTSYNMPNIYSHIQQSGGDGGIQNNTFFDISYKGTVYYPLDSKGYYELGSDFTLKNWSKQLIIKGNEIPDMVVTYNVTDTNISTSLHNSSQIKMMRINGNKVDYTQSYIFENVGEYTVEYFTHRPNAINLNNCNTVSSVIIGENITLIEENSFNNCSNLTSITSKATTAPTVSNNSFSNIAGNGTLYYPKRSDYSSWMSTDSYYLGYYNWTSQEIEE